MAFRIVFHWGSNIIDDRESEPFKTMPCLWPRMAAFEARKPHGNPSEAQLGYLFQRDKDFFMLLHDLVTCSRQRIVDANTACGGKLFIPSSIEVVHVWIVEGEFLPWENTKQGSKFWGLKPPKFLEKFPYTTVYHGDPNHPMTVDVKTRRAEYAKIAYKPKVFKG